MRKYATSELITNNSIDLSDTVRVIFEKTTSEYSKEYFRQMVLQLAKSLGSDYTFIGELDKDKVDSIYTLAFCSKGEIIENRSFQLENTPCENVINKSHHVYTSDVASQFPQNEFLSQNNIEAYLGIPLFNSKNNTLGVVVCMFEHAVKSPQFVQDVIQIFSSRISTEIERINLEDELRRSENRFQYIADNSTAWNWEVDEHGKFTYTSNKIHEILGYYPSELIGKKYFYELYSEPNLKNYKNYIFTAFQEKISFAGFENQKLNKNGETVWFKTSGVPIIKNTGELLGYRGTSIDISEQKKTELQIQEQNEFLRTVLNALNYPFYVINVKDYTISHSNYAGASLSMEDKTRCYQVSHNRETPCCDTEHSCPLKITVQSKKSCMVEHTHTKKNGIEYPCEVHCHPIFNKEGKLSQVIVYSIDRTEREQANWIITQRVKELQCLHQLTQVIEKDRSCSEEKRNEIIHIIPQGFQYPEHTGCSIMFHGEIFKTKNYHSVPWMLKAPLYNEKKLVGNIQVCFNKKSNTDPFLEEEKELLNTISQQLSTFIEQQHNEKLRDVIYTISEASNTTDNLPELIDFIYQQLSQLIDTSNFYLALYNGQKDLFTVPYSVDQKVDIHSFSAGKSLTNYVLQKRISLLITRDILNKLENEGEVISIGKRSKVWLGVPLMLKGKAIGVLSVQNYYDEKAYDLKDLEILEFVSHQISISVQRKMADDHLKDALLKAQESDLLKTAFLSTISHELRTPLNAIIGFSELICNEWNKEQAIEFSKLINQSGLNLLGIVDNILNITQLNDKKVKIDLSKFQIHTLCLNLLDKIRSEQDQKAHQNLTINFKPSLTDQNLIILSDQDKLFTILYNFLDNAIKFTAEGEVLLGYIIENRENVPCVKFFIKDSGIGISPNKQNLIFNLFRQEDDSQTRKFGGTGIGLSLAKRYTELLNGHIDVQSEVGVGSEFTVWIPLEPNQLSSDQ